MEKVSVEKIRRKLWKHLDLQNHFDPYFLHRLNILCRNIPLNLLTKSTIVENLASQNLLPPGNMSNFLSFTAPAKSVTNESQRSPDRSSCF